MAGIQRATPTRRGTSRRHVRLGWFLSLALHATLLAGLVIFCRFVAVRPVGGGGGGTGGAGGSVLAVDLSGLGSGEAGRQPDGDAPATDDGTRSTQQAATPQAPPEARPTDIPAPRPEQALPIPSAATAAAAVSPADPKPRPPRKARPRPVPDASAAPVPTPGQPLAGSGHNDTQAGPPGTGPGWEGGATGQGGGTGGGSGHGDGPAVGPGQGLGEEDGMRLAAVDTKPRIQRQVEPDYPAEARRRGLEGHVVARLLVATDGGVARVGIVSAQPPHVFDQAVLAALRKWRFHPARFEGRAVAAWVMLPIRFHLKP